jgi:hypothetical protein
MLDYTAQVDIVTKMGLGWSHRTLAQGRGVHSIAFSCRCPL